MAFEWSSQVDQAAWWVRVLHPFAQDVGSVVPDVFPSYAGVFHPVDDERGRRTWADVAAENGRIVHAEMQFHEIRRRPDAPPPNDLQIDNRLRWGSLPGRELELLASALAPHTTTPHRCWWCVWEGYAQLHGSPAVGGMTTGQAGFVPPIAPGEILAGPRVSVPQRSYLLMTGQLSDVGDLFDRLWQQSPNVWWPDDRAWFVATEIDFAWTYVGGTTDAIDAVLAEPKLETLLATPTDGFRFDSDVRNAELDGR